MVFGETFILWAHDIIVNFSYLGVFFLSIVGTSTLFIPMPLSAILSFSAGIGLNPLGVGIVVGLGDAVGELTGYLVGLGGRTALKAKKESSKFVKFFTNLYREHKEVEIDKKIFSIEYSFFVIMITAAIPFPFDIIGIISGMSNYDIKKFYIATAIGKTAKALTFAYLGHILIPILGELIF